MAIPERKLLLLNTMHKRMVIVRGGVSAEFEFTTDRLHHTVIIIITHEIVLLKIVISTIVDPLPMCINEECLETGVSSLYCCRRASPQMTSTQSYVYI